MNDKRRIGRSLCADLMRLEWKDRDGWQREIPAVLEDIAPGGACLQVEEPVPVGSVMNLCHGESWGAPCRSVYCEFREIGYFVGVEFLESDLWSQQAFRPQHLLDMSMMLQDLNRRAVC